MVLSFLTRANLSWIAQHRRSLGIGALIVLLAIVLLRACNAGPEQAKDPFARYRPAMKVEFQNQLDKLTQAPRYDLDVQFDPKANLLLGKAIIHIVNSSPDPWPYLIFRLYPMLEHYQGKVIFQSVAVGDRPVPYVYQAHNTAMRMDLPAPLAPRKSIEVRLAWKLEIPVWPDASKVYVLFGNSQQMTSLPLFYPSSAVGPA